MNNKEIKQLPGDRKLRILIAEDEQDIGDLLVDLLAQDDREIHFVHNGLEAVKRLREQEFDLLITDLMMPEVDGMEVIRHAKKLHPQILTIIITGYASLETAIQAVKEGAYDYLRKPFRLDELKISVDNACERIILMRENQLLLNQLRNSGLFNKENGPDSHETSEIGGAGIDATILQGRWLPPSYFEKYGSSASTALSELERLGKLLKDGLITQEEYSLLKRKLLNQL